MVKVKLHRYAFQGQEYDKETGMEAFQLRLWDGRIGRWLSVDPYGEFYSPYLGMGNNPIGAVDPDGGSTDKPPTWKAKEGEFYFDPSDDTSYYGNKDGSWVQATQLQEVVVVGGGKKDTPWMDTGFSQMGVSEILGKQHNPIIIGYHSTTGKFKNDEMPWCASYVNWCFNQNGILTLNSARAYDYKKFGKKLDEPAYGALVIMNYSHIGFLAGENKDGRIILLGGNQGNAVNLSPNSKKAVLQYRYPKGYAPNYNLPMYQLKGRSTNKTTSR